MRFARKGIKKYKGTKMAIYDLANSIALAQQKQEGYGTPQAVTINANNNPGALRSWPGYPTVNGFAQFPNYETGFQALVTNVTTNINKPDWSLADYITRYEGGPSNTDKNNIPAYISSISSQTGIPANVPLSQLVDSAGIVAAATPTDTTSETGMIDLAGIDWASVGMIALVGLGLYLVVK